MSIKLSLKPIQVGLLGVGTVGGGTFRVLQRNQEEIKRRAGRGIEIGIVAARDLVRARSVVGCADLTTAMLGFTLVTVTVAESVALVLVSSSS